MRIASLRAHLVRILEQHPGPAADLALDALAADDRMTAAPDRRPVHRARGLGGEADACPQCGADIGQPCNLPPPVGP